MDSAKNWYERPWLQASADRLASVPGSRLDVDSRGLRCNLVEHAKPNHGPRPCQLARRTCQLRGAAAPRLHGRAAVGVVVDVADVVQEAQGAPARVDHVHELGVGVVQVAVLAGEDLKQRHGRVQPCCAKKIEPPQ